MNDKQPWAELPNSVTMVASSHATWEYCTVYILCTVEAAETFFCQGIHITIIALNAMLHALKGQVFRDEFGCPNLSPDTGTEAWAQRFPLEILHNWRRIRFLSHQFCDTLLISR